MPKAKKKAAKKDETPKKKINCYLVILDKSGSMGSVVHETVTGFNEQVQMVKDLTRKYPDQEFLVSLVTFNHDVDTVFFNAEATELDEIAEDTYAPDGRTALYDAVGLSVNKMRNDMKKDMEKEEVQIFATIFTDGWENASTEFTGEQFSKLMTEMREDNRWTITYIGAGHDIEAAAQKYGIPQGRAAAFDVGKVGTKAAMRGVAATMRKAAHFRSIGHAAGSAAFDTLVSDTYNKAYSAEVDNITRGGVEAAAVWTADADAEEAADKAANPPKTPIEKKLIKKKKA